ncbi:MAG: response regulator transcription factor [Planctomycetota bacterium]
MIDTELTADDARPRLLVVEDESHLATGLKLNFELEDFVVEIATTGRGAAEQLIGPRSFAVIVLDAMLPDIDGFDLCRRLRESGNYTPVILLTARAAAEDRVRGLEAGADDYLVKPFQMGELLARVRSLLRRRRWESTAQQGEQVREDVLNFGTAQVNFATHEVTIAGQHHSLTRLELDLLRYFADNEGRVIGREELLENVWKLRNYPNTRTVDNFVMRIRKCFEPDPARPVHFLSVRGAGYKFQSHPAP